MMDSDWTTTPDSQRLLASVPDTASRRKYRLLGVAFCRLVFPLLDERARRAVEAVEQFAEGLATDADLNSAGEPVRAVVAERAAEANAAGREAKSDPGVLAVQAVHTLSATDAEMERERSPFWPGDSLCEFIAAVLSLTLEATGTPGHQSPDQADLVRDIFAQVLEPVPFRLGWCTSTAVGIARQLYVSGDFSAMPILADALQDAGCESADVLDHCRGPCQHVRGCWVVDLILGKE